jgi:hypothetical protein
LNDVLLTLGISLSIQAVFFAFAAALRTDRVDRFVEMQPASRLFRRILCWCGVLVFVAGNYSGWAWTGLVGPLSITWILLKAMGIPTLEASADKKWRGNPAYRAHLQRTSRIIPWPPQGA